MKFKTPVPVQICKRSTPEHGRLARLVAVEQHGRPARRVFYVQYREPTGEYAGPHYPLCRRDFIRYGPRVGRDFKLMLRRLAFSGRQSMTSPLGEVSVTDIKGPWLASMPFNDDELNARLAAIRATSGMSPRQLAKATEARYRWYSGTVTIGGRPYSACARARDWNEVSALTRLTLTVVKRHWRFHPEVPAWARQNLAEAIPGKLYIKEVAGGRWRLAPS